LLGLELVGAWQGRQTQQAIAALEAALNEQQMEIQQAESRYPAPQEDPRLRQRVSQLQEDLRQKQQILGVLSDGNDGNTRGFADHLGGLANQHLQGLWLSRLTIAQGGQQLGLVGGAQRPELVPQFLQRLGNEPGFAGKEFKTFRLSRVDQASEWIQFEINTAATEEMKP
ncbi:MAG: PilN domain-containing protein, partial [Gammaproteobacteria bacterium]